ncbi:GGDEF domain-containing protein [Chitinimonas sp. BJYL2]|uniref:GGDEF domain-containing protein n=1 Tax=Chitinimonas sp. BJYL2 TaxID=2976696 RepID=UPI0022B52998|nr:GGDEF domain-containing protein [Chitinimonas sp. BJYL2]
MSAENGRADFETRLSTAEQLAQTGDPKGMVALDGLLAETSGSAAAERRLRVQDARCWRLAVTDPTAAGKLLDEVLADAAHPRFAMQMARLLACRGYVAERTGKADAALADYETAVATARRLDDRPLLARVLALRGEQYGARGRYADAITDLKAAYELALALDASAKQSYALNALANLYADRNVRDYDQALVYYRLLLKAHEANQDHTNQAATRFNIASTLESQGKLEEALAEFRHALALDRVRGLPEDIAFDERAVGIVLSKLGRHEEALKLLDQALATYERSATRDPDARESVAMVRLSRGVAYRRAGQFARALADIDVARQFYLSTGNLRFLETIHAEHALALAGAGDWRGAFAARGDYIDVYKQLQTRLLDERTARLRVQFQTEQTQRESQALARANAAQQRELVASRQAHRWQLTVIALSLVVIALLGWTVFRQIATSRRLRDMALMDELTRLPNRRHFLAMAEATWSRAQRNDEPLTVAGIDIDHFKRVNDTWGHAAGDLVLQRTAHALRTALRPGDTVGRLGGEEFCVLMPRTGLHAAAMAAERLRLAVGAIDCSDIAPGLSLSISLGLAEREPGVSRLASLLQRADEALYRAKANGRNRIELAQPAELASAAPAAGWLSEGA